MSGSDGTRAVMILKTGESLGCRSLLAGDGWVIAEM
jgi:hypothetical protein